MITLGTMFYLLMLFAGGYLLASAGINLLLWLLGVKEEDDG